MVLTALLACVVLVLFSLGSARAAEARPGRQISASTGATAQWATKGAALIAEDSGDDDCHKGAAANECCSGYCPFAIISLPADPAPPSAAQALPEVAFAGDYQTDAIWPERPPRRRALARLQAAERT